MPKNQSKKKLPVVDQSAAIDRLKFFALKMTAP
jgi:hypothetical protein